jgi:hypothetical protein
MELADSNIHEVTVKGAPTVGSIARSLTMMKEDADKRRGRAGERRVEALGYTWRRVDASTGRMSMTFAVRSQS